MEEILNLQDLFFLGITPECERCQFEIESEDIEYLRWDETIPWSHIVAKRAELAGWGVHHQKALCPKCLAESRAEI